MSIKLGRAGPQRESQWLLLKGLGGMRAGLNNTTPSGPMVRFYFPAGEPRTHGGAGGSFRKVLRTPGGLMLLIEVQSGPDLSG